MPAALNLSAPALSLAATSFQPSTVVMVLPGCARTMVLEPRIELRSMAIDLNSILGSKTIVLAHPGKTITTVDGWKEVAAKLNAGADKFKAAGIRAGYHNHDAEWKPIDGMRPIEIIAKNTRKEVT